MPQLHSRRLAQADQRKLQLHQHAQEADPEPILFPDLPAYDTVMDDEPLLVVDPLV